MRKALSLILAVSMIFTMSISAFAAPGEPTIDSGTGDITGGEIGGEVKAPNIDVTLSTYAGSSILFDIYNQLGTGQQIISAPMIFTNHSTVPVELQLVDYTITVTGGTGNIVSMSNPATINDGTAKNMLLYFNTAEKIDGSLPLLPTDYVFPEYNEANDAAKVFTKYDGTAASPVNPIKFAQVERGVKAIRGAGSTIDTDEIPAATLKDTNKHGIRFDGMMNENAPWAIGETIVFVPTFKAVPKKIESLAGTLSSTSAPTVSSLTGAGAAVIVTSPAALTTAAAADLATLATEVKLTIDNGHSAVVKSVAVAADKKTLTINVKSTDAAAGDKITIAIPNGTLFDGGNGAPSKVTVTVV